ncbi:hypothetical protein Syn6312_0698 [Synechococcus sp. PCC 6312]|nr:hypothetical protein Syn6312_0698 [Synechococcus sp. PCC 6312]
MSDISRNAQERGLTPEILNSISTEMTLSILNNF